MPGHPPANDAEEQAQRANVVRLQELIKGSIFNNINECSCQQRMMLYSYLWIRVNLGGCQQSSVLLKTRYFTDINLSDHAACVQCSTWF